MDQQALVTAVLATLALGGLFFVFVYPILSGEKQAEKRKSALTADRATRRAADRVDASARRKQIADSLKEVELRSKRKRKTLEGRVTQAGLIITRKNFYIGSVVSAVAFAFVIYVLSGLPLLMLAGLAVGGLGAPNWWLNYMGKRRMKKFNEEFPAAIDIIIRGVKSGLPLGDCLRVIASESPEPVRSEFRLVVEAQQIGLSVTEAIERLPDRIPTPEANFFTIALSIQQKAGGNLAETLGNLSRVLRDRKKMQQKIYAMSSEAKASAGIIAALPVAVSGMLYFTSPHYIELLWITSTGRFVLMFCACFMAVGVFIMKKMIEFDI